MKFAKIDTVDSQIKICYISDILSNTNFTKF